MLDMNTVLLYFLLSESSLKCNFTDVYSQMNAIVLGTLLVWQPISGWLTDVYAKQQHRILLFSAVVELAMLGAMLAVILFSSSFNPWSVLGFQMVKQLVEAQLYNSIWKILKMRLAYRCPVSLPEQCSVLISIGMTGELVETAVNMLFCGVSYSLIVNAGAHFTVVRCFYFCTTAFASLVCLTLSSWIACNKGRYYLPETTAESTGSPSSCDNGVEELACVVDTAEGDADDGVVTPDECVSLIPHQQTLNSDGGSPVSELESIVAVHRHSRCTSLVNYVTDSWRNLWTNVVARRIVFHSLLVYILYSIQGNAEYIAVPGRHVDKHNKTLANFCGGYLTNMVYQDVIMNGVFCSGALFFLFVLLRARPSAFYRISFPALAAVLAALTSLIVVNLDQTLLAVAMSLAVGLSWFLFLYDGFVAVAVIPHTHYGFYSVLNGYIQNITDGVVYLLMYFNTPNWIMLVIGFAAVISAGAYSLWFGWCSSAVTALRKL